MNDFHTSDGTPSLYELTEDQATGYLKAAIWAIDGQFGKGFAKENPALIGTFMQTCAQDFHTRTMRIAAQDLRIALGALNDVAMAIEAFAAKG